MLIDQSILQEIDGDIAKLGKWTRDYALGGSGTPFLTRVYLMGRAARSMNPDDVKLWTEHRFKQELKKAGYKKTPLDESFLATLIAQTEKWIAAAIGDLEKSVRAEVMKAEAEWTRQIYARDSKGAMKKSLWDNLRASLMKTLAQGIEKVLSSFQANLDRLFQTEVAKYFQYGQTAGLPRDELVYKIPRPTACPHCMRLHLNADGSPRVYRLGDVLGSSNVGKKDYEWGFTIGPVHPHCYCILYTVEKRPPHPSKMLAQARKESLTQTSKKDIAEQVEAARKKFQDIKEREFALRSLGTLQVGEVEDIVTKIPGIK